MPSSIQDSLESFCNELAHRVPDYLDVILTGQRGVGREKFQQDPEQFVAQYLVWPICDEAGYEYITEWFHEGNGGSVDLFIRNTSDPVLGEIKRLNHYPRAVSDLREYLNHRTVKTNFGIATDGITWILLREPGDSRRNPEIIEYHSFRGAIFDQLVTMGHVRSQLEGERVHWNSSVGKAVKAPYDEYGKLRRVTVEESGERFRQKFSPTAVSKITDSNAFDTMLTEYDDRGLKDISKSTLDDF